MACELRVRTSVELVLNFEYYKNHHQYRDFMRVSPDLEEACRMCALDRKYSSIFTMQALSSVIGREIVSVYPAINGLLDKCLSILNTVLLPRISTSRRCGSRIFLLWTRMAGPIPQPRGRTWIPDHFVPLIEKVAPQLNSSSPINVDSPKPNFDMSPLDPKLSWMNEVDDQQQPCKSEDHQSASSEVHDEQPSIPPQDKSDFDSENHQSASDEVYDKQPSTLPQEKSLFDSEYHQSVSDEVYDGQPSTPPQEKSDFDSENHQSVSDEVYDQQPSTPPQEKSLFDSEYHQSVSDEVYDRQHSTPPQEKSDFDFENHQSVSDEVPGHLDSTTPSTENMLPGRFLDIESLCELLKTESTPISAIPKGVKENVYFLINNDKNIKKRMRREKSNFEDDCGVWLSKASSTKKTIFHCVNGAFKVIEMKNGQYSTKRQNEWVPLEPQPVDDDVMIMRRFYTSLKRKTDYKKRVTWIEKASSAVGVTCMGKAVVEYLGTFPSIISVHGNSKKGTGSEYVKTCATTKEKINDRIKNEPPRNVYCDMVLDDSMDAPRNLKQIQNFKQAQVRENKLPGTNRKNTADDVQTIMNMLNHHPFIQEIVQTKGKPPMVILYTDDQLKDIKKFCLTSENTSILGVDRTFNLGACFVTLTVFKNSYLLRRSTQLSPIMLGPLFLHWDGTCQTYQRFFSHLRTKFDANFHTEVGLCDLIIGSDEEKAIMKAVQQSFPNATQLLCQRHLEQNVRRYLQHKVGVADQLKNEITSLIFGKDGLINSKDLVDFELTSMEMSNKFLDIAPNFASYFDNSLVPRVRDHIFKPRISGNCVSLNWTNNNCESINNILKLSTNWKLLKLPDLIEKLYSIVKLQYADMRRALHGHGNFELIPKLNYFVLPHNVWCQKSESEKNSHFQKFMSTNAARKKTKTVTSTDGKLDIPGTRAVAKKPGQRKRVRAERTRTQNKRHKVDQ